MPFYTRIEPDPALARGYVYMLDAIDACRLQAAATPDPLLRRMWRLRENRIRAALQRMWREYEQLGVDAAHQADTFIRQAIKQTAVRPPASGRLESAIQSRPLPSTFPAGAIGIADLDVLEKIAARGGGTYWRAQEYGTTAHVGRIVPGYFQPGQARPSAAEFRVHPYFGQATGRNGKAPKGTPAMRITRPLHARYFMRDGTTAIAGWHAKESVRINQRAISALAGL